MQFLIQRKNPSGWPVALQRNKANPKGRGLRFEDRKRIVLYISLQTNSNPILMALTSSLASQFLPLILRKTNTSLTPFHSTISKTLPLFPTFSTPKLRLSSSISTTVAAAAKNSSNNLNDQSSSKEKEIEVEVEEELPWIQEKALDLVEFTGSVTQALPGPRVGPTSFPWILAVPLAYVGVTFVIAFVKTVNKFTSPKAKRRRLVSLSLSLSLLHTNPNFFNWFIYCIALGYLTKICFVIIYE